MPLARLLAFCALVPVAAVARAQQGAHRPRGVPPSVRVWPNAPMDGTPAVVVGPASLNGGFEIPSSIGGGLPWGWREQPADGFLVGRDCTIAAAGRCSLRIRRDSSSPVGLERARGRSVAALSGSDTVFVLRDLVLGGFGGRTLRLQASVRTDRPGGAKVGLIAWVGRARDDSLAFETHANEQGATTSMTWHEVDLHLRLDSGVDIGTVGVTRTGPGTTWIDDLRVTIDSEPYDAARAREIPPGGLDRLRPYVTPIQTPDQTVDGSDLAALLHILDTAHLIGLGEATHGTHEFKEIDARIARYLIQHDGATAVTLELPMMLGRDLDRYVQTGRGDPHDLLKSQDGFWTWDAAEIVELMHWMRSAVRSGHRQLTVGGFDTQSPESANDSVLAYVRSTAPQLLPAIQQSWTTLDSLTRLSGANGAPSRELAGPWIEAATHMLDLLGSRAATPLTRADSERAAWTIQDARILVQAGLQRSNPSCRDSIMATNIRWLVARQPRGSRAILLAHITHVARGEGQMGGFLRRSFGDDYRALGLTTYGGRYLGRGLLGYRPYQAVTSPSGSIEDIIHRLGVPAALLDVRGAAADPRLGWLAEARELRSIGATASEPGVGVLYLPSQFDGLVDFDQSTPAHLLDVASNKYAPPAGGIGRRQLFLVIFGVVACLGVGALLRHQHTVSND